MKRYLLAAAAVAAISTPAIARDGQGYAGIEAGVAWVKGQDADVFVDFTTTQLPITDPLAPGPADASFNNAFSLDNHMGYDIGIFGGYDFGGFRIEGEIDWKHANLGDLEVDGDLLDNFNGLDPDDVDLVDSDFEVDQAVGSLAFMLNGLADFGDQDGVSFQAGLGFGWNKVKFIDEKDGAWAWQVILGLNYALSPNLDLGMRYKYFSSGNLHFGDNDVAVNSFTFQRGAQVTPPGGVPVNVIQTIDGDVFTDLDAKFRSHSLVATLTYNFGAVADTAAAAAATATAPAPAAGDADVSGRIGDPRDGDVSGTAATAAAATAGARARIEVKRLNESRSRVTWAGFLLASKPRLPHRGSALHPRQQQVHHADRERACD